MDTDQLQARLTELAAYRATGHAKESVPDRQHHQALGRRPRRRNRHIDGALDHDQRNRLLDIAERAPVSKTLKQGVAITTRLAR